MRPRREEREAAAGSLEHQFRTSLVDDITSEEPTILSTPTHASHVERDEL
jgi:hypothetical protein